MRFLIPALLLSACFFDTERHAGGEDFPNTVTPLGRMASDDIGSHYQWDQFQDIPKPPDTAATDSVQVSLSVSLGLPATLTGPEAAPMPAAADTVWDFSDTAAADGGVVRRYIAEDALLGLGRERRDTAMFRWHAAFDTTALRGELALETRGYILLPLTGKRQSYRFFNRDGAGRLDLGEFALSQRGLDGVQRVQVLRVLAGPDGDIETRADNRTAFYGVFRIRDVDTLESTRLLPDGDSALWGAGDSGRVELRHFVKDPLFKPQVSTLTGILKAKIWRRGDSAAPLSYRQTRQLRAGGQVDISVQGLGGDSLLAAGDTALVAYDYIAPAGALLLESRGRFRVVLGPRPFRFSENALLGYTLENRWRSGVIRRTVFSFTPDSAVVSGRIDIQGRFTFEVEKDDGKAASVEGTYRGGRIEMVLREEFGGRERSYRLLFDAAGNLLEKQILGLLEAGAGN